MRNYINSDLNVFRCKIHTITFIVILFWIFSVVFCCFTETEIIDIIGKNILPTILFLIAVIDLINCKRSWLQLTSYSIILRKSKKLLGLKMKTIEIPYKDIQLIRINQIQTKIGTSETLEIKYKGENEIINFPMLNDMFRFEQEIKNR